MNKIEYVNNLIKEDDQYVFKLILLGNSGIGKSCFVGRFIENQFLTLNQTIGGDYKCKNFYRDERLVKLQIWDTGGQERFNSLISQYYRGINGIILMYDITQPSTAHSVNFWLNEINKHSHVNVPIILAGNKSDLEVLNNSQVCQDIREVREIISDISLSNPEIVCRECSALTGENVESIFLELTTLMIEHEKIHQLDNMFKSSDKLKLNQGRSFFDLKSFC